MFDVIITKIKPPEDENADGEKGKTEKIIVRI